MLSLGYPGFDKICLMSTKIMLLSFNFHKKPEMQDSLWLMQLYETASALILAIDEENKINSIASFGPYPVFAGAVMSTCVLLRLLKSPFGNQVKKPRGEELFFIGIRLLQTLSTCPNDNPSKCAQGLARLWKSDRIFKHRDGSWDLDLRNRNRLAISILHDLMRWSREESDYLQRRHSSQRKQSENPAHRLEDFNSALGGASKDLTSTQEFSASQMEMMTCSDQDPMLGQFAALSETNMFDFSAASNEWWLHLNWGIFRPEDVDTTGAMPVMAP